MVSLSSPTKVIRWGIMLVLVVVGVVAGLIVGPGVVRRFDQASALRQVLRAQRQCLDYAPPPDRLPTERIAPCRATAQEKGDITNKSS